MGKIKDNCTLEWMENRFVLNFLFIYFYKYFVSSNDFKFNRDLIEHFNIE